MYMYIWKDTSKDKETLSLSPHIYTYIELFKQMLERFTQWYIP